MKNITSDLISFSDNHDLWNKAKASGIDCLKNYFLENQVEFLNLTPEDFSFEKKEQKLIFWSISEETFILRTTYSLTTNNNESVKVFGNYSIDVNTDGEIIDDWLVFN